MSKKEQEIHSDQGISQEITNYTLTGYYNSRLSCNFCTTSQPKLSFDRMTIVGNLNKNSAKKLSDFMSYEPKFRLWDILQTKFKAKALEEKVYIEYDKIKAEDRKSTRLNSSHVSISYAVF